MNSRAGAMNAIRKIVNKGMANVVPSTFTFIVPEHLEIAERADIVAAFGDWLLANSKNLKPGDFYQLLNTGVAPVSYLKNTVNVD